MTTPFFLRLSKTIEQAERFQNQAKLQAAINKARNEALPTKKKKSVFGEAIKMAANFTPNVVEDVAKSTGRGAWEGLQGWNNQVQSVPAALFTKGKVQDGQYTTERNLIGNPFANVVSHVEAQRKLGIAPKGGNILEDIGAGFESARLAGKAYEEDPDIASGVKFGTGVIFEPTSYLAAGTISKLPKIAGIGGAKGKLARAPINLIEGFDSPAQVGKFAVGGAIGTELANKYDVPGVPEGLEQFLGGMGGGITGAAFNPRKFEAGLAKMQGREGKPAAVGFGTEVVEEGERLYHGTPTHIPKGEIIISPRGDLDAGFYLTRDYEIANSTVEGDTANVTNFPGDFVEERRNKILEEGGQQVMRFKPKDRDLLLLRWSERLTEDEAARINNVLKKRKLEPIANTSLTPQGLIQKLRPSREGYGGQTPGALGVFIEAGFDGFSEDIGGYPQLTVFKPNEVLEEVLTPPTVLKGSAQKRAAMEQPAPKLSGKVESTVGDAPIEVELIKENGKWFFLSPNGYKGMAYDSFADAKADAKAYGYKPVYKGPISEIDNVIPFKKPGAIPNKEELYQPFAKEIEESGYVSHLNDNDPVNFAESAKYLLPENLNKYKEALTWGEYELFLNSTGTEQLMQIEEFLSKSTQTPNQQIDQMFPPKKNNEPKQGVMLSTQQLSPFHVKALKEKGFLKNGAGEPADLTLYKSMPENIKQYYKALDWGDSKGYLNTAGKKQFDDVVKMMDEIEPTKGVQNLLDQGFVESPGHSILYKYDPATETLQAEGKTFVATKLNGEWVTHLDDGTKVTGISIGNLVDEIDMWDGFSAPNIQAGKPNIAKAIQPVDPDEIAGINKPSGPKTVDEFIEFTEQELGPQNKYGDAKSYSAPGQEGAPIAGAPKPKGSVTPIKQDGIWSAAGYHNEDLGDLMDELIKAGYKVNSPEGFGGISGGALPETLVTPITPQIGLTKGEKIGNAIAKVKKFVLDHGVENNAIATPIAKEYIRINNVMKTQATNLGKLAQRVEKLTGIHGADDSINTANLTPEAKRAVEALKRAEEAFYETQVQFGVKNPLEPADFWRELKLEESSKGKRYSDMLHEYGNAIANKVSDQWMKQQINRLSESIELSDKAGKPIPTSSVSGISDVKLPKAVGDVLSDAVHKIHPRRDKEFTQLFNAINNQLRGMWAAGDASFIGIQQLPTWADNPRAAATAIKAGFHALQDPSTIADFILKHDEAKYGTGSPTVTEFIANGLHIAQATGEGTDLGGIGGKIQSIKGYGAFLKKSNTLFTETGNINRIQMADYLWEQYKQGGLAMLTGVPIKGGARVGAKEGMSRAEILKAIAEASNRATGYSTRGFGGPYGSALFFAPRFMQSQIETVMKASWGNQLENQVARRQMAKLIALGTGITVSINEINGEDTDFDPRSSNFLRIKNIGGSDLSIFGPWDTLVRGIVRSVPHVTEDGDFTLGEPQYLLRSKLSPVLSSTVDFLTGENIVGEPSRDWSSIVKNTFLPFSVREAGEEPLTTTGFGALGMKASPLTETERLENKLKANNILKSDPDYLIKRKEYLKNHPEDVPEAQGKEYKQAREIQDEIAARRKANDELAFTSGQTLVDFREKRKNLLTEQRLRLNEVLRKDIKKASSKQQKWLNEYFDLFDNEENKDFITGEINPDKFDEAVAAWANKNGTEALDFVNRYMGAGLNTVEKNYYNDLRKLEAEGYFKLSRYTNMKSDLTEDEIDSIVATVDSFRVGNPGLQDEPWATTAKRLLKSSIDSTELLDVIHSRLKKYQNPERNKLKEKYAKELLWFNPRADWKSYSTYTANKSSGGKLSKPNIGGALKANIKPALK